MIPILWDGGPFTRRIMPASYIFYIFRHSSTCSNQLGELYYTVCSPHGNVVEQTLGSHAKLGKA